MSRFRGYGRNKVEGWMRGGGGVQDLRTTIQNINLSFEFQ